MKKSIKFVILIILVILIVIFGIIFSKKVYLKKVSTLYQRKILEKYNISLNLKNIEEREDKLNNKTYILTFGKKDGFNFEAAVITNDILDEKNENYVLNINDIEFAKKVQDYYGSDYEVIKAVKGNKRKDDDPLKNGKYDGCYSFCVKNKQNGMYISGLVPENGNIEEMFDFGQGYSKYY